MELQYLVHEPATISPSTPLLILLHGYGSNEEDLFSFVPTLPQDSLIVSFRAPKNAQFDGYSWFDINLMDVENRVDILEAKEAINLIFSEINKLKIKYNLTNSKVNLCGFSQGGIICYALALHEPELFSKIAILSAYPEEKLLSLSGINKKRYENLRFFISHGSDDTIIPLEWGRKGADLLYDLNCFFSFREYMNGHGVNQKNYMDLMEFFAK